MNGNYTFCLRQTVDGQDERFSLGQLRRVYDNLLTVVCEDGVITWFSEDGR